MSSLPGPGAPPSRAGVGIVIAGIGLLASWGFARRAAAGKAAS